MQRYDGFEVFFETNFSKNKVVWYVNLSMILLIISSIALVYSLSVQGYRAIKNMLTPAYKKTPEYQEFEKQLNNILTKHKVNNVVNSSLCTIIFISAISNCN